MAKGGPPTGSSTKWLWLLAILAVLLLVVIWRTQPIGGAPGNATGGAAAPAPAQAPSPTPSN